MKYWSNSEYLLQAAAHRVRLQQVFFLLAAIALLLNYALGVSIAQMGANPLLNQDVDAVYLLLMVLGVPQLASGTLAPWLDAAVLAVSLAAVIWPRQIFFPRAFCVLYFIHFTTYNMIAGHHYINIAVLIMSFAFIFKLPARFAAAFSGCRFLFCFMMFTAAVWKIVRGNLWYEDQASMLLLSTHLDTLVQQKEFAFRGWLQWLLQHKQTAHGLWIILICLEATFFAGFITYRLDRWLLMFYLLFFLGGYIFFNIYNYENLLFLLTLQPVLRLVTHIKPPEGSIQKKGRSLVTPQRKASS
jgi:hypothetical protein